MEDNIKDNMQHNKETVTLSNGRQFTMRRDKAIKYYKLTHVMANLLSKDPSTKVGAILLNPDTLHVLSMGYNGMPRNVKEHETEKWARPIKYKYVEHAERNAIYNAAHSGTPLRDSICVASMCPCSDCARGLIQSGCRMVITRDVNDFALKNPDLVERWKPEWDISIPMMEEAGIKIIMLTESEIKIEENDIL